MDYRAVHGHPQRFPELTIWLACLGTLAAVAAAGVVWLRGGQVAGLLYPHVRVSDALWPLTATWFAAVVLGVLSVAFILGKSLRLGAALATAAAVAGLAGSSLAGRGVDFSTYHRHMLFADPTRQWQFVLLWLPAAALLLAAAVLAAIDSWTGVRRRRTRGDAGGPGQGKAGPGNEGLDWPGSHAAGVGTKSNAHER
ncbi:MAG TPA: hypothetical protein VK576_04575, partial [Thermoleophilia bacterium]|nr:hypothetical protein [Thermoleophilia bacterium]